MRNISTACRILRKLREVQQGGGGYLLQWKGIFIWVPVYSVLFAEGRVQARGKEKRQSRGGERAEARSRAKHKKSEISTEAVSNQEQRNNLGDADKKSLRLAIGRGKGRGRKDPSERTAESSNGGKGRQVSKTASRRQRQSQRVGIRNATNNSKEGGLHL